ncbi:glycosyltransferase family 2 protein [Reyranella aquatilis]|uniref:Glycosyltransferase family 2 protein n=1 Tax=Reyranella aquatilis TaxID=2035356 RepID=A0ABS8KS21_9HYPH|nr:glycosyltransferase family A protein [Reyranella aquatilis]MCC8428463.1 glycosyltransferase family 2 protein [Reyranella aquatilis]
MGNRVSIVIPTHNRASLLRRALVCVQSQTLRDKEIVVVVDGSTDDTLSMLATSFPEVKVVHHPSSKGPSAARNAGVAVASGEWIFFHDDDDLMHPSHLAELLAATLAAPPQSLVAGRSRDFAVRDDSIVFSPPVWTAAERSDTDTLIQFLEPTALRTITHTTILWPRRLFDTETWDETLSFYEDFDLCGRAILSGLHVIGREVGMYYIRVHGAPRITHAGDDTNQLLWSARYWLKWAAILRDHPEHRACAEALRNGLMDSLIRLSIVAAGRSYMPQLAAAFREWGGERYYVTPPPRSPLKRKLGDAVLNLAGFRALHLMLAGAEKLRRREAPYLDRLEAPANEADRQDAFYIGKYEGEAEDQTAAERSRATIASSASR